MYVEHEGIYHVYSAYIHTIGCSDFCTQAKLCSVYKQTYFWYTCIQICAALRLWRQKWVSQSMCVKRTEMKRMYQWLHFIPVAVQNSHMHNHFHYKNVQGSHSTWKNPGIMWFLIKILENSMKRGKTGWTLKDPPKPRFGGLSLV